MRLLERDSLLAELEARLGEAATGHGSMVLIAGEAGAGKTSLVKAFVSRAGKAALALTGACDPLTTPRPLGPLLDLTANPESGLNETATEPFALFTAVIDRLRLTSRPILLVIEDVHWADDGTLDFLRFLGRRIGDTKAVVLCTYRDDEVGPDHPLRKLLGELATLPSIGRLQIPPLTVAAVRNLGHDHVADPERLHQMTGGNAFYVTEVIAAGQTMPTSVQDAVLSRVARLGKGARRVVEAVAIAPRELEVDLSAALTKATGEDVDQAIASGVLLGQGETLRFRHELARAAVEDAIPFARRLQMHRQMLEALRSEGSDDFARLVHHAFRAGDDFLVAELAPLAAREASSQGAYREAGEFWELAVGNAKVLDPEQAAEFRLELARAFRILDRQQESLAQCHLAARHYRLRGNEIGLVSALIQLAVQQWTVSDASSARRTIDEAIGLLEAQGESAELAQALYVSAWLSMLARHHAIAIRDGRRALAMSQAVGTDAQEAGNILNLGTIEIVTGDIDEGIRLLREARRLGDEMGNHHLTQTALVQLGSGGGEVRRYQEAREALEEAVAFGLKHDQDYSVAYNRAWLARIAFEQGRWDDAVTYAEIVLKSGPGGSPIGPVTALGALGRVRVRRGDPGAREPLEQALAIGRGGEMQHLYSPMCGLAELAWLHSHPKEIPGLLDSVYGQALAADSRWARGEVGFWMWKAGAIDRPPEGAAEPFALHMAGDWAEAARAWREIGCPYEEALALSDGDQDAMRTALSIFDGLGAGPAGRWLRARMRDQGVEGIPRGPRPETRASPVGLTTRQTEVLRLMCQGFDNSEIATRLFISKKTTEHHVSAVMEKIGAPTRAMAIARAGQLGLIQNGGAQPPT